MSAERFKSRKQKHRHGKRTANDSFGRKGHTSLVPNDNRAAVKRQLDQYKKAA